MDEYPVSGQVVEELAPLLRLVETLMPDLARERVWPYFDAGGRMVDVSLFAHMVRFELGNELRIHGVATSEYADDQSFGIDSLPLSGLQLSFQGYCIKILKSSDGRCPPAGTSQRREAFYNQQIPLHGTRPNIVFLWDFTPNFTLRVAMPVGYSASSGEVNEHFNVLVSGLGDHDSTMPADDYLSDTPRDLDISANDLDVDLPEHTTRPEEGPVDGEQV